MKRQHEPPADQTPTERREAREQRWTDETALHWHPYKATPATQARADAEERTRSQKPDKISTKPPQA